MPQSNIYFDEKENIIIEKYSNEWKLSKPDTVKKIILKFGEQNGNNE